MPVHLVRYLLTDRSKAFDCLPHELLIAKLDAYGFDKSSLKLIHSYLSNRKQRVKINDRYSSWVDILFGVPQGSILGPLSFNIFICDMCYFLEDFDIANHADQTTLHNVVRVKVPKLLSTILNNHQQFSLNGLTTTTLKQILVRAIYHFQVILELLLRLAVVILNRKMNKY